MGGGGQQCGQGGGQIGTRKSEGIDGSSTDRPIS